MQCPTLAGSPYRGLLSRAMVSGEPERECIMAIATKAVVVMEIPLHGSLLDVAKALLKAQEDSKAHSVIKDAEIKSVCVKV